GRTVLPARTGNGHRHQKQNRPRPPEPNHAPPRALPDYEYIISRHTITHSTGIAPKQNAPRSKSSAGAILATRLCKPGLSNLLVRALAPHNVVSRASEQPH